MKQLKFIHITKTAGTSIENIGHEAGIEWGRFHNEYAESSKNHKAWWHDLPSNKPDSLLMKHDWFMVVRNPYTRMISEFHCKWGGVGSEAPNYTKKKFNKVLRELINNRWGDTVGYHYTPQHLYLNTNIKTLHVLRFENLQREFEELMSQYSMDLKLDKHVYNHEKKFSLSDLDRKTIKLINKVYVMDFKTFDYEMMH